MKQNKSIVIFSLIWEILRYVFIFLFTANFFIMRIYENNQGIFWLLSISSCNLLLPLILIILLNSSNTILMRILYIGKILQLFPFFMLISSELLNIKIFDNYLIEELISRNIGLIISFLFIDLLFLSLLLSYNVRGNKKTPKKDEDNLPDISSIPISDVSVFKNKK